MSSVTTMTRVGACHLQVERPQPQSLEERESALLKALRQLNCFNNEELAKLIEAQDQLKTCPALALTYAFLYVVRAAIIRHGNDIQEPLIDLAEQFIPMIQKRLFPGRDALAYIRDVQVHVVSASSLSGLRQQKYDLLANRAIDGETSAMCAAVKHVKCRAAQIAKWLKRVKQ